MGGTGYLSLLVLITVYQCDGDTHFNDYKTLHPKHVHMDWMKCVPDSSSLSSVSIPGTHQSLKREGLNPFRNFQAYELISQLQAGVRFFDMTVYKLFGTLYAENNAIFYKEKFSHVLSQLQTFVRDKTSEAVLLRLTGPANAISDAKEELSHATHGLTPVWKDRKIPTMGEARGKIVLIRSSDFDWGLPVNAMELREDNKEIHMEENIKKASQHCAGEMMLTDNGAKGTWEYPRSVAVRLNKQLDDHLLSLYKVKRKQFCLGIIAMDFPGPKLIEVIINFSCGSSVAGFDQSSDTGPNGVVALNETTLTPGPPPEPTPGPSPKPNTSPTPGPSAKPNTSPTPGPSPKPDTSPTPGPSPKPNTSTAPGPSPKPDTSPTPGPSPQTETSSAPGPSPKPDTSPTPGPSPQTETSSAPGPSPKPDTSPTPGPPPQTETSSAPGPSPKPDTSHTPGPSPQPDTSPTPGPSPKPDTSHTPGPSPQPDTSPTPGPSPQTDTSSAPGPSPQPDTSSAPGPSPKPDTSPAPAPKPVKIRKKICRRVHKHKHRLSPLPSKRSI